MTLEHTRDPFPSLTPLLPTYNGKQKLTLASSLFHHLQGSDSLDCPSFVDVRYINQLLGLTTRRCISLPSFDQKPDGEGRETVWDDVVFVWFRHTSTSEYQQAHVTSLHTTNRSWVSSLQRRKVQYALSLSLSSYTAFVLQLHSYI